MPRFAETMGRLAGLPDEAMEGAWHWPGRSGWPMRGRDALYLSLLEELAAGADPPAGETRRLQAVADAALGDLCGLVTELPGELIDQPPGPEQWSIRQILGHVLLTERRYLAQTRYAAERAEDQPIRLELDMSLAPADTAGTSAELIGRLEDARRLSHQLDALEGEALARPTVWAGHVVDVRFRLHRFAVHIIEHGIQTERTMLSMGRPAGEARRIVRAIWAARGRHAAWSAAPRLAELDEAHAARASMLA